MARRREEPAMHKYLILMFFLVGVVSADPALTSGLKPGEMTPAHHPQHITGPDAGTTICPV